MRGKLLVILSIFILILTTSTVATKKVVFEEQAAGYRYKVTFQEPMTRWEIGYKNQKFIIEENGKNKNYLEKYRNNVEELNIQIIKLIIYTFYLISILIVAFFFKKKMKIKTYILVLIIVVFSTFALVNIIQATFEINSTYKEATKYYHILAK
ncbi:hypothetical protein [Mesobacillus foraminis]|uniref:hypothetical protein n=1 Tax=Mesobacillus foraminis TaxID=279826 RepID=UPI000EF4C2B5|nr:hypothetical protein [Mesobacillus foraminis]